MIQLSLEHLYSKSPYKIIPINNDLDFFTDTNTHYRISFTQEAAIGGCDTYQFIIRKVESIPTSHDPKVEATILTIIDEFFRSNLNVLLYICDTSDNREEARNRLFLTWFERNAEPERFTIRTANAEVEGEGFYAAIIVENRNPKLKEITEEFEQTAQMLREDKPENN